MSNKLQVPNSTMSADTVPFPPLEVEAEKIYHAIFRENIPPVVKERFTAVSSLLNDKHRHNELDRYYKIIQNVKDLEAYEIACRHTRRLPLLSTKFCVMVYIAETIPENQSHFINQKTNIIRGWAAIAGGAIRTAFKMGKGLILLAAVRNA